MIKHTSCYIWLMWLVCCSAYAIIPAVKPSLPSSLSCAPVTLKSQHANIILGDVTAEQRSQIYFLKNNYKKSVWIEHPVLHPSASAGWTSYLRPGRWSALVLDKKEFAISCALIQPGKVIQLNCKDALMVCLPQHISLNKKRKGSYWLAEDKTWEELVRILNKTNSSASQLKK